MQRSKGLFDNQKLCEICHRPLPLSYSRECCPRCRENKLFQEVKQYIRENTVNEHQVADHFNIPVRQVKKWIREGRIEYRTPKETPVLSGLHCQRCGIPVSFGSLCSKCMREATAGKGFAAQSFPSDKDSQMRFLDFDDKNNSQ